MADVILRKVSDAGRNKHRKATCAGCRRRKSKCDGRQPRCTTCVAYKDDCHYDKPPSLAYVRSLEEQISELKIQLHEARSDPSPTDPQTVSSSATYPALKPHDSSSALETGEDEDDPDARRPNHHWDADISVDDLGGVTFHNSTSAIYQPAENNREDARSNSQAVSSPRSTASSTDNEQVKRTLVLNAANQRQWEDYAISNTAVKVNVPKEVAAELLKYHWCWIHPLFLFVYRPAFIRGMALANASAPEAPDPPYFSATLVKVIYAHCSRFINHSVYQQQYMTMPNQDPSMGDMLSGSQFTEKLIEEARISLSLETLKPSSIPTIQALLQQSTREVTVFGRSSQGWLYSGMAFRMAIDMGIHLPTDKLQTYVKSLSDEDVEIRKRLFWSCYTWDKIISIYMGRMPNFTPATGDVPIDFLDDTSDTELWAPYYGESPTLSGPAAEPYPPCPGHVVSCFTQHCKLSMILNDLMLGIYSSAAENSQGVPAYANAPQRTAHGHLESPFIKLSRELREWWIALPPSLRIAPDHMPTRSPPAHLVTLNLMYHTALILLHRPFILGAQDLTQGSAFKSYAVCISATAAIHDLLILQASTFGLGHITYLNSYSAYIAATIAVLRFEREHKPGEDHNISTQTLGLKFLLEVLQHNASSMPALDRSLGIIRKRMKAVLDRQARHHLDSLFYNQMATQPPPFVVAPPQQYDTTQPVDVKPVKQGPSIMVGDEQVLDFNSPIQNVSGTWHGDIPQNVYTDAPFADDYLPAFPGQRFPTGSEQSFGSDVADPQVRASLMGFNLDSHPRLLHADTDWSLTASFNG